MRKYIVAAAAAVAAAGSAVAQDLKMATLPANLPPAVIMATFANVVSSEVDGLNIEVRRSLCLLTSASSSVLYLDDVHPALLFLRELN